MSQSQHAAVGLAKYSMSMVRSAHDEMVKQVCSSALVEVSILITESTNCKISFQARDSSKFLIVSEESITKSKELPSEKLI